MRLELKHGLQVGLAEAVWLLGGFSLLRTLFPEVPEARLRAVTGLLGLVILFLGVLRAIRHSARTRGPLSYGQAVKIGCLVSVTVAAIVSASSLLYVTILAPGFHGRMVREAAATAQREGAAADEVARRVAGAEREFSTGSQVVIPLVAQTVAGSIFSLVIAAFFRRRA